MTARSRLRDEQGMTLVELLVTMSILSVVMGALLTAVVTTQRAGRGVSYRVESQGHARTAIAAIGKDIRAAAKIVLGSDPAFEYAGRNRAVFTANLDDSLRSHRVTIELDAQNRVVESVQVPPTSGPGSDPPALTFGAPSTRFVAQYLSSGAGPVFRYYRLDAAGNPVEMPAPGDGSSLTYDERADIDLVEITLTIERDPAANAGGTTVTTRVRVPNNTYVD